MPTSPNMKIVWRRWKDPVDDVMCWRAVLRRPRDAACWTAIVTDRGDWWISCGFTHASGSTGASRATIEPIIRAVYAEERAGEQRRGF